jgi:hypothetical protein
VIRICGPVRLAGVLAVTTGIVVGLVSATTRATTCRPADAARLRWAY